MQQKYVIRDRCILLFALLIFSIGTYSLFANINSNELFKVTVLQDQVKGTVTDTNGVPIPGVTIKIQGTSTGTFTDDQGVFFISASPSDILILTYIGFKSLEVSVGNSTELFLVLQEEITNLDAVTVNAGYYTVKERERTGSIAKVTSEEIELQPIVSPLEALQGRMAGVEIDPGSGLSGSAPSIKIRGQNSLRYTQRDNGNYPLYIIDGIPINSSPLRSNGTLIGSSGIDPLSTLSLNNIASIEILKDADATAIYGSRGANGVVLITTKKGSDNHGKTSLDINLYSGLSEASNKVKLLKTSQYLSIRRQAIENDGLSQSEVFAPELTIWDQNRYTDWQEELFGGVASSINLNMAVYGGNDQNTFRLGGSYFDQGSIFPGKFGYNKLTSNISISHRSKSNKFHLSFLANYGVENNKIFDGTNFINYALSIPPNAPPIYNNNGSLNWENWVGDNPFAVLEQPQSILIENLLSNINLSYAISPVIRFKINIGYSVLHNDDQIMFHKERYNPDRWEFIKLGIIQNYSKRKSLVVEPQLNFSKTYDKINISALIGGTYQDNKDSFLSISANGFSHKNLLGNLNAADVIRTTNDDNVEYRYAALFGRIGINWHKKYFLNITGRRDGSSRFGSNRKFSNFWAFGGAWIFSDEDIIKNNLPFVSFGKLRGSYGTTGNDQIPDYGYLDSYEVTDGPGGLYPTQLYNPYYSWEVNKKLEVALQLGFLHDLISVETSWYRNRSSNQLVGYPLPSITGFSSVQANLPALVQNTGWEFLFRSTNLKSKDFIWQTSFNFTIPENELVEFDNIDQTPYANQYKVGHPLNIRLLYQYDGIDPETGFYRVLDTNDDGRYNIEDRVVIKSMGRKYYGGINNQFHYKGISLQFLFEYIKQRNTNNNLNSVPPGFYGNQPIEFKDVWVNHDENTAIQKPSLSSASRRAFRNAGISTLGVTDASFLRLKNVSLSYRLPPQILEKLNLSSGQIYLRAQNLLTITSYNGLDPQGGVDKIPPLRTITCGIQATL